MGVTIEVPVAQVDLVRRLLAYNEDLDRLALAAPDGTVFDACESAVITGGRDLQLRMLERAVARQIETAENLCGQSRSLICTIATDALTTLFLSPV